MKGLASVLSSGSAFAIDFACVVFALRGPHGPLFTAACVFVHALAAACAAAAVQIEAPPSAARARVWFFAFSFALAFFVPLAGVLGVQVAARAGLTANRRAAGDPWMTLGIDEEWADRRVAVKRRGVSASRIASILGRLAPEEAERRFQAILQVKHLRANQQVAILKLALKDPSDEVRLFAFSRIEKFRSDLEANIKEYSTELERAQGEERALLHLRLAESFHEIAYLRLAEGAVLDHALEAAHGHALAAKQLRPTSGPSDYLLGRILLLRGDHEKAIAAFQSAVRQHYPRAKILPYMAECAFRQRRYDAARAMLRELARVTRNASALQPLVEFWQ